jgi:lactoylglutathione lyase
MKLINKLPFPDAKFDLYFLAFDSARSESAGKHWTDREGVLELTHNYGTENDPSFKVANGNEDPGRGFGHICFSVDNLAAACNKLLSAGVKFKKTPDQGTMRHIAFALDPDGYWLELINLDREKAEKEEVESTDVETYRFNHTMIRVKDIEKSLNFYRSALGMSQLRKVENPNGKFDLYFLGYRHNDGSDEEDKVSTREGILELTYNCKDFAYAL